MSTEHITALQYVADDYRRYCTEKGLEYVGPEEVITNLVHLSVHTDPQLLQLFKVHVSPNGAIFAEWIQRTPDDWCARFEAAAALSVAASVIRKLDLDDVSDEEAEAIFRDLTDE